MRQAITWLFTTRSIAVKRHGIHALYAQRAFNAQGIAAAGNPIELTSGLSGPTTSAVAMDAAGGFVVAWVQPSGTTSNIMAQLFNSSRASAVGSPIQVNASSEVGAPAVAMDAAGDFLVAWNQYNATPNSNSVDVRSYAASGAALTGAVPIDASANAAGSPSVSADASGNYLVAWDHSTGSSTSETLAQRFNNMVSPEDNAFIVAAPPPAWRPRTRAWATCWRFGALSARRDGPALRPAR